MAVAVQFTVSIKQNLFLSLMNVFLASHFFYIDTYILKNQVFRSNSVETRNNFGLILTK